MTAGSIHAAAGPAGDFHAAALRRDHWRERLGLAGLAAPALLLVAVTMLLPVGWLFSLSFLDDGGALSLANYRRMLAEPSYTRTFVTTFEISLATTAICILLGYPLAYFLVFTVTSTRWRNLLYMSVVVPLWVSYLLRAYTWKIILGTDGALNSLLVSTGIVSAPLDIFLYNQTAMVITLVYIFVPFMVMPLFTVLDNIPRRLIEASEDLGVGPFMTFWKEIVPLSLGGVIAGSTMTFCLAFGDFVAPVLAGGPDGTMVANLLQTQFGAALNWPLGSALATLVLVIVLVLLQISSRLDTAGRVELT